MNRLLYIIIGILGSMCFLKGHASSTIEEVDYTNLMYETSRTINVETAGSLASLISETELCQLNELKITGHINDTDRAYLKNALDVSCTSISLDFEDALYEDKSWSLPCFCLVGISLPKGISEIESNAFQNCTKLEKIIIPEGVTSIGNYAFQQCTSLHYISLPNSLTTIGQFSFDYCTSLECIRIPQNVQNVGYSAFAWCTGLKKTSFASLESFLNINFSDNTANPLSYAHHLFWGENEQEIKEVIIPSQITVIKNWTFTNCSSIESVVILDGVREIEEHAFSGCSSLINVDIPNSITAIKNYTFQNCNSLKNITIPSSVTRIGNCAFENCRLSHIILPDQISSIGNNAFDQTEIIEFTSKVVPGVSPNFVIGQTTIVVPYESYDDYCNNPSFQNLALLGRIVSNKALISQTVELTAMKRGSCILNVLGEEGIANVCNLTLKGSINGYDFMVMRNKMPNLMNLDMTEVQIVSNPYEYYAGSHTKDNRLGPNSFKEMVNLRSVKLPSSITDIDKSAFYGCSNLRDIELNEGLKCIGNAAFQSCSSLERVEIPASVETIEASAFYQCQRLSNIVLKEGLQSIGASAFYHANIESIIIPSTVETIGSGAFSWCTSLKEILLPTKLRTIESEMLSFCLELKTINIPPMVEIIGNRAFAGSNDLQDIYVYLANPKDISISQNTFNTTKTTTLHVPAFGYNDYYLHTQWGQFLNIQKFDEDYTTFYTKNTVKLNRNTGVIEGTPDALLYEHGSLVVNEGESQLLKDVTLKHDGKDGASLIPENTGNIRVEKLSVDISVRANNWHFFCFPFNIDLSSVEYDGDYIWRQYDGVRRSRKEGGWQNLVEGTTVLQAGRGYIFRGSATSVLHLQAIDSDILGDDVSASLDTYQSADTDPADASWNFLGNPYTSYYIVDEDTYNAPITVWTGNGYEAYRPGDDDYEFAPYEAFFVQGSHDNDAINFNSDNREGYEDMQAAQSQRRKARAHQRKVNPNRLLVNLQLGVQGEDKYIDKTRVVFNDECSLDYESDCDAAKFFSEERCAELYTIGTDGTQYSINERPEEDGNVDLGFVANQKGKYTICAQRMDVPMLLVDDVMDTTFDLRNGAYEFSSAKGTFNKRFYLKRYEGITTSIKDLADQIGMNFCISDGTISIEGLNDTTRVCLYNMAGQQIATQQGNGTFTAIPGTYVISVGKLTAKVAIK